MAKVKLGFDKQSVPDKIEIGSEIVTKMTGNANYPTPNPTLKEVEGKISDLQSSYTAALDGGKTLKAAERVADKALTFTMNQLAAYVQNASGGDELAILSSGMGVRKPNSPKAKMDAPQNVQVKENTNAGEVSLIWKSVLKAKSYNVQCTQTPEVDASWVQAGSTSKALITITGLASLKLYWFRVAALGPLGIGPWSQPVKAVTN